jgi:hypothetical protein
MPIKSLTTYTILSLLLLPGAVLAAGELSTLFTTPQERQLINANRYKNDEVKPQQTVQNDDDEDDDSPIQRLAQSEVSVEYQISGISLAGDGANTVWINAIAYEDGALLDDGSRIKVLAGDDVRVRITVPDGKHYFATSGETLSVSYMAAVEN